MRCIGRAQDDCVWMGEPHGSVPFVGVEFMRHVHLMLNGWSGDVERETIPLDVTEDCSVGLLGLGYDLQEFDLKH